MEFPRTFSVLIASILSSASGILPKTKLSMYPREEIMQRKLNNPSITESEPRSWNFQRFLFIMVLVSLFNGISTLFRLFNAKAILLEEQ